MGGGGGGDNNNNNKATMFTSNKNETLSYIPSCTIKGAILCVDSSL